MPVRLDQVVIVGGWVACPRSLMSQDQPEVQSAGVPQEQAGDAEVLARHALEPLQGALTYCAPEW